MAIVIFFLSLALIGHSSTAPTCSDQVQDYCEALHLSLLFYEAQRSGALPEDNRVPWRGDSSLGDKGNNGEDLTGGYHDAGDYVKFGLPMAAALTILSDGGLSNGNAYEACGQMEYLKDAVKWGTDYLIKAHVSTNEFYCQVGGGDIDHAYPGSPEKMNIPRPAYSLTPSKPGSDCAGESAAALASAAMLFADSDPDYSAELMTHASQLFDFADTYRGIYSESIVDADKFYHSNSYEDELIWSALHLYKATGDASYLSKAEDMYASRSQTWTPWSFDWDNKLAGAQLMLYEITGKELYYKDVQQFCDSALLVDRSPGGQTFLAKWGSNRYASNFAYICLGAANAGIKSEEYASYAKGQIGYMLGANPNSFSYLIGYGDNYPRQPHHKAASCPTGGYCNWDTFLDTSHNNPHELTGALVGGPSGPNDYYKDDRTDYIMAEVTLDYNAGFQSTIAGLKGMACTGSGSTSGPVSTTTASPTTQGPSTTSAPATRAPSVSPLDDCSSLFTIGDQWEGGDVRTLKLPIQEDMALYNLKVNFDKDLTWMNFFEADPNTNTGPTFTATNSWWFNGKLQGETLDVGMQINYWGEPAKITSIELNGVKYC